MAADPVADSPIVYPEDDFARLLAEVEYRSGRRRRHQQRAVQATACVVLAVSAWLSSASAASGEVRAAHHPVAVSTRDVGGVSRSGT